MYDQSEGKVLLLAAVEHCEQPLGQRQRRRRLSRTGSIHSASSSSSRGNNAFFEPFGGVGDSTGDSTGRGGGDGGGRGGGRRRAAAVETYQKVDIFPDDDVFGFTIDGHLLVLAETQTAAEDLIVNFGRRRACGVYRCDATTPLSCGFVWECPVEQPENTFPFLALTGRRVFFPDFIASRDLPCPAP